MFHNLSSSECKQVAEYLEKTLDNKMEQALNGKTLEDYSKETSELLK